MHVLFTLTYYTPYVSGLTIYVKRIAEALAQKGYKVSVLTSQHDNSPREDTINGVKIYRVPFLFKISKGFFMPTYVFEVYKTVKNADIIFVNLPQAEGFIVATCAKILHKKLYCIYHCDLVLPRGLLNLLINKIVVFFNWISLILCDKIIVYTNEYAESSPYLQNFKQKFIQIFPPIYALSVDENYYQQLVKKYRNVGFIIGFAARIAEEKGLEYLIEAIKNMDNAKLFIAGPKEEVVGEKKYVEKINKLLEDNKNKIIFFGNLNEGQMRAFYKFIDLLVVSSVNRTEAFGLVQAEAMFAGKPVVATDLPGVRFLVNTTGAGEICKIRDAQDLKRTIDKINQNYKFYQEKTKNVERIINLEKTIDQYINFLS